MIFSRSSSNFMKAICQWPKKVSRILIWQTNISNWFGIKSLKINSNKVQFVIPLQENKVWFNGDNTLQKHISQRQAQKLQYTFINSALDNLKYIFLYISQKESTTEIMKNVFYCNIKALFVLEIFKFLYFFLRLFFPLSAIAGFIRKADLRWS